MKSTFFFLCLLTTLALGSGGGSIGGGGGGGGVDTIGSFGSSPNSGGGSISGSTLTLQPADATHPGGLSTGTQDVAGKKVFSTSPAVPLSSKSIVFANSSQQLAQDANYLSWDPVAHQLNLGDITQDQPETLLHAKVQNMTLANPAVVIENNFPGNGATHAFIDNRTPSVDPNSGIGMGFRMYNSSNAYKEYGVVAGKIDVNTAGAEYGSISLQAIKNGTVRQEAARFSTTGDSTVTGGLAASTYYHVGSPSFNAADFVPFKMEYNNTDDFSFKIYNYNTSASPTFFGDLNIWRNNKTVGTGYGFAYSGNNSSDSLKQYAWVGSQIDDNTAGAEYGAAVLAATANGTVKTAILVAHGNGQVEAPKFKSSTTGTGGPAFVCQENDSRACFGQDGSNTRGIWFTSDGVTEVRGGNGRLLVSSSGIDALAAKLRQYGNSGASSGPYNVGSLKHTVSTTSCPASGGSLTDCFATTLINGDWNANGGAYTFESAGSFAATVSTDKQVKVILGGTTLFDSGSIAVTSANSWSVRGSCLRADSTHAKCNVVFDSSYASLAASSKYVNANETMASDLTLKIQVGGTNASDTIAEMWRVTYNP